MASTSAAAGPFTPPAIVPGRTRIGWIGVGTFGVLDRIIFEIKGSLPGAAD